MARKPNYSFQKRERDASKVAKRHAKQAARERKKEPTDDDDAAASPTPAEPFELTQGPR